MLPVGFKLPSLPLSFSRSFSSMAYTFLRRLRLFFLLPKPPPTSPATLRPLSAAASPSPSAQRDPKLSLSARLSFVFDQIDALERQRDISGKDEALQRIRAWRQSKHPSPSPPSTATVDGGGGVRDAQMTEDAGREEVGMTELFRREVEVVHPWPEWIELMERLSSQNYFDYRRVEEDRVAANAGIDLSSVKEGVGLDLTRDWASVRTACMNFGRDRFDLLKSLSRKDIQTLVGHGCPSMDPKVVFSAKLLRKYVRVDEGDVCSSCSLRNTCRRGYILVPKEDEARTLDVMRILLTYGFDHVKESVENDPLRKMKSVKTVVRKLLHEVVKLSAVPRDPNLLPPVIKKPPPKVKQPPPQPKRRVGRDDIEMKKGDWLCSKCDFMNFAKNTVCLQCDAKRPKRQLLPGEWECPKCNFLNYRRNMSCFQCEYNRPPDEFTENHMQGKQMRPTTRLQRVARTSDVSNAWNFDFDDDESDGADVAAFEFADSIKARDGSSLDEMPRGGSTRDFEDDNTVWNQDRRPYVCNPGKASSSPHSRDTGFDDFDDEDDNVDNYELDEANGKGTHAISRKSLSEFENDSGSENSDDLDQYEDTNQYRKDYISDFDDDDIVVSARNTEHGQKSFDSGDGKESIIYSASDMHDNYDLKQTKKCKQNAGQKGSPRKRDSDFDDEDDDEDLFSSSSKKKGITGASDRIRHNFKDSNHFGFKNNGRNSFVHGEDDLFSSSSKNKGIRGASDRKGRNLKDSNHFGSKNNGRNSFVHDEDGDDDLCSSRNRKKGNKGAAERTGRRFQDSSRFGQNNNERNSFARRDDDKFDDWGGSNLRNRSRVDQSCYGARNFQRSRAGSKGNGYGKWNDDDGYKRSPRMADHRKVDYRQRGKDNRNHGRSSVSEVYDFSDNNQRRRIIER